MAESLKGKVAVISGAGSGFGKATAELFAALDQVNLVLIDFNAQALKATADACKASGSKVVALAADVTKPETWQKALKETLDNFGKIDFLLNSAGGALKRSTFLEIDDALWDLSFDLNVKGTFYGMQEVLPHMLENGAGTIVNIASMKMRKEEIESFLADAETAKEFIE